MGTDRAVRIILLGIVLGAGVAAGGETETRAAQSHWEQAVALERAGRCAEAIRAYRAAAGAGHPESAVLTRIGACHQRLAARAATPAASRLDHRLSAAGALSRAIRLDPANREALGRLGDLALEAGDPEGALAVYRRLGELAPEDPRTGVRLGRARARLGDHEAALAAFRAASQRAEEMQTGDPGAAALASELASLAHLGAAQSLIALGRREAARDELARVLASSASQESRPATRARMLLGALGAEPGPAAPAP